MPEVRLGVYNSSLHQTASLAYLRPYVVCGYNRPGVVEEVYQIIPKQWSRSKTPGQDVGQRGDYT